MKFISISKKILGDLVTPVGLFLKVREEFSQALLLESSDYASKEDSLSFICFEPLIGIQIENKELTINGNRKTDFNIVDEIDAFLDKLEIGEDKIAEKYNSLFGYSTFDAVQHFEDIEFDEKKDEQLIPVLRYDFYRYIYVFDHYYNDLYIIENVPDGSESNFENIEQLIYRQDHLTFPFRIVGTEESDMEDKRYKDMVTRAKSHCQRGDVFQIVLSRRFKQNFKGDEFNVYRALRSINPSPYLFYFDYGTYKIFGSSPEAQLKVENDIAEIHPIAGTFRRTGDPHEDQMLAQKLLEDPKETSEHVMLVDLARNDLSKNTSNVRVNSFKEVQYFSHVIHLVSKVTGKVDYERSAFRIFADTFPAGTLSGAPKYKAMELINKYEPHSRSFYGGGLGLIHLKGGLNHAIIIRSFLSMGSALYYQAGAGLVINSIEENELQEVNNKLAALKKALNIAEGI